MSEQSIPSQNHEHPYALHVTSEAEQDLDSLRPHVYSRVRKFAFMLKSFPDMGSDYNPKYDAAFPPVSCKQLYVNSTTKVIYYIVDHSSRIVTVFRIGDARQDPTMRFTGIHLPV